MSSPPAFSSGSRRLRVGVVTRNLPPMRGGIERLVQRLICELAAHNECIVIGPTGSAAHLPETCRVQQCASGIPAFHAAAALAILREVRAEKPDVILAASGLVAPLAQLWARCTRRRYGVLIHGLDLMYPNPVYQNLFLPAIRGADVAIANSARTAAEARARRVPEGSLKVVFPGTDLPEEFVGDAAEFRRRHGLAVSAPLLLFVGRLVRRKGLVEFVARALPELVRRLPGMTMAVIGEEPNGDDGEIEAICAAARDVGVSRQLRLLGGVDDHELDLAYRAADCLVFPVLESAKDIEGFGLVAVEAAARGTPTAGFAAGGVVDAVGAGSGRLVAPGDYAALVEAVIALAAGRAISAQQCRRHAAGFTWASYGAQVEILLRDITA